ncbi:MAG: DUF6514 family protein [Sarcina sp.]
MKIVKSLVRNLNSGDVNYEYSYKIVSSLLNGQEVFGIEAERLDYKEEVLVNIERDLINIISFDLGKVEEMFSLVSEYIVSPIHLIDVLGEKVDLCIQNM